MPRPELSAVPQWYHGYINLVKGNSLMPAMKSQTPQLIRFFNALAPEKRNFRYAKGKWTMKEVLQHMIDAERIFAYRALCIARKETISLPGFDENSYAENAGAKKRDWSAMMEELKTVRKSTELLFESFGKEQLSTMGVANNNPVSVLAIGFIIVGHTSHHLNVIKERYLAK